VAQVVSRNDLTDSYHALSGRLLDQAGRIARQGFISLGSWRDEDAARFVSLMGTSLAGIKREAAKLSVAYYAGVAKAEGQRFINPIIATDALSTAALRNGATTATVYNRPFVDLRTAISQGKSITEAVEAGAWRATNLARTEVQLARRNAGLTARSGNSNIVGYLRTLSGAENCALCYVASTQRYTRGDLLPIHPGCDCGETPIYGSTDPGQIIDEERLNATHQAVGERFGRFDLSARDIDYRQITIQDHGELGPVLTVKGQNFTGPDDF
jgi:hypothetical protein